MKKINLPALTFCGLLNLGIFNCTSAPPEVKRETLEFKLDAERNSQTYTIEIQKGNLSIGINPVRYEDGKAGYLIGVYEKKSENESIDMMFEVYEDRLEIYDGIIKKNRLSASNCFSGEIKVKTPDFFMIVNKQYQIRNNEKVFSKRWQVYGKVFGKSLSVIDIDGDGNPESISHDNNMIKLYPGKRILKLYKESPLEKNRDLIIEGTKLFEKAKKYFLDNVGDFEEIRF